MSQYRSDYYSEPDVHESHCHSHHHHIYYPQKNAGIALILCFFFGVLGFHRFYVGKVGTGLLWFFTGGFFGIGFILDFLSIAFGSFRDKFGYPLV